MLLAIPIRSATPASTPEAALRLDARRLKPRAPIGGEARCAGSNGDGCLGPAGRRGGGRHEWRWACVWRVGVLCLGACARGWPRSSAGRNRSTGVTPYGAHTVERFLLIGDRDPTATGLASPRSGLRSPGARGFNAWCELRQRGDGGSDVGRVNNEGDMGHPWRLAFRKGAHRCSTLSPS
jgi:hypothetical protein